MLPNETIKEPSADPFSDPFVDSPKLKATHTADGSSTTFTIMKEKPEGGLKPAELGDMVSNRLSLLRINPSNKNQMILINPTINSGAVLTDVVIRNATFVNRPTVYIEGGEEVSLISEKEIDDLEDKFENAYQPAIIVSTEPLDSYIESGNTINDGQIFVQIEG